MNYFQYCMLGIRVENAVRLVSTLVEREVVEEGVVEGGSS